MKNIFLQNNEINKALINGLIQNGWSGSWYSENDNIVIQTNKSNNIDTKLDYYKGQRLAICLGIQIEILASFNKSFLFIEVDDISVINDDWYIINSYHEKNDKIVDILRGGSVTINSPINFKSKFMAPELNDFYKSKNKELPFNTNVSCLYYSVGLLIIELLEYNLDDLNDSQLYHFLKRCLEKNPNNRFFIFV